MHRKGLNLKKVAPKEKEKIEARPSAVSAEKKSLRLTAKIFMP